MRANNKISGIDVIGEISWGTHFCQFYQTKEDLIEILVPYFKAGLENNEFCIWITSETLDIEEAKEALRRVVPDINTNLENNQIQFISYPNRYSDKSALDSQMALNNLIENTHRALANGYNGVRYSGDIFFNHEKILDSIIGKYPIIALCTYPVDKCNANTIFDIISNHQFALIKREGEWERIEGSRWKNITDTKLDEEILRESKELYRMLFINMTEGFALAEIIYDQDGKPYDYRFLELNPAFELNIGIKREHILGKSYLEVFSNANREAIEEFNKVAISGKPTRFETFSPAINRYFEIYAFSLEKGKIAAIFRDITGIKNTEKALLESEEQYRAFFENSMDAILLTSPDGNRLCSQSCRLPNVWNDRGRNYSGWTDWNY